jgi:hypothetical protein
MADAHGGTAGGGSPTAQTELAVDEYIALRQEWCGEVLFRRQRIYATVTWLAAGAVGAALWLVKERTLLGPQALVATGVGAGVIGCLAILAVWNHKRLHNRAARRLVRLNEIAGLFGTLIPHSPDGNNPSWGEGWGREPAGWEQSLHTVVLWTAFSLVIVAPHLAPSTGWRSGRLAIGGCTGIHWTPAETVMAAQGSWWSQIPDAVWVVEVLFTLACVLSGLLFWLRLKADPGREKSLGELTIRRPE